MHRPVIVVGIGRTGTSTVSRLLHEKLGVRMFTDQFLRPDQWNPKGYYEDRNVKWSTKQLMSGVQTPEKCADFVRQQYTKGETTPWGFKLIVLHPLPPEFFDLLNPRAIIACVRDRPQTIESIKGWHKWNARDDEVRRRYDYRSTAIKKLLHGRSVLWLDFSQKRTDEDLTECIKEVVTVDLTENVYVHSEDGS